MGRISHAGNHYYFELWEVFLLSAIMISLSCEKYFSCGQWLFLSVVRSISFECNTTPFSCEKYFSCGNNDFFELREVFVCGRNLIDGRPPSALPASCVESFPPAAPQWNCSPPPELSSPQPRISPDWEKYFLIWEEYFSGAYKSICDLWEVFLLPLKWRCSDNLAAVCHKCDFHCEPGTTLKKHIYLVC